MSFQAMAQAVKLKTESPTDKLVLLMLANFADENNQAYPSYKRLAEDCCMTERGIKAIMGRLKKAGYVTWEKRKKANGSLSSNLYTLHLDKAVAPMNTDSAFHAPGGHDTQEVVNEVHQGSAQNSPGVVHEIHQGSERGSQKPIKEPVSNNLSMTPSESSKPAEAVFDFDLVLTWILVQFQNSEWFDLDTLDKAFVEAKLEEYQCRYTTPNKGDALSYVDMAMRQRHGIERRSAKAAQARDALNDTVVNQLETQAAVVEQHTRNLKPRTTHEKLTDRSWAEGLDLEGNLT